MSQVNQLYRLQQLDTEIRNKKQRLTEVINAQRETKELINARGQEAKISTELQTLETSQRDLNLELGGITNKRQRSEQRLYSGKVQNPKELEDLQNEVAALGRRRADLEDEVLETMILIEDTQEEKKIADQSLVKIQADWEKSQAKYKLEQGELVNSLSDLLDARKKQLVLIEPRLIKEYDALAMKKNGIAVAGLLNGRCTGCHISASANKVKSVQQGDIVYCGGCDRILSPL